MLHLETYKEPWKILVRIVTANSMFYWFHPQTSLVMSLHLTLIKSKHQPLSRYWDHHQPLNYWPSSLHYCPKGSLGPDCNMWSIHPPAKTFQWISYRKQHKKNLSVVSIWSAPCQPLELHLPPVFHFSHSSVHFSCS